MQYIILLIIISIIGNVIKGLNNLNRSRPGTGNMGTGQRPTPDTGENISTFPPQQTRSMPKQNDTLSRTDEETSRRSIQIGRTLSTTNSAIRNTQINGKTTFGMTTQGELEVSAAMPRRNTRKSHTLDFTSSGVLNSIILSEILEPPKAKR